MSQVYQPMEETLMRFEVAMHKCLVYITDHYDDGVAVADDPFINKILEETMIEGTSNHSCVDPTYHHDTFEDMYRCNVCDLFFYPSEIGKSDDPNAGYKSIGKNDARS